MIKNSITRVSARFTSETASLKEAGGAVIDYKNVPLLRRFITEQGKILGRRFTGLTAKQQREVTKAIKQARVLGLLQFVNNK